MGKRLGKGWAKLLLEGVLELIVRVDWDEYVT